MKFLSLSQILGAIAVGAAAAFIFTSVNNALALPDVWFSYSTNECVKVLNYAEGDNYSCENLPRKFHHVWVE